MSNAGSEAFVLMIVGVRASTFFPYKCPGDLL